MNKKNEIKGKKLVDKEHKKVFLCLFSCCKSHDLIVIGTHLNFILRWYLPILLSEFIQLAFAAAAKEATLMLLETLGELLLS